MTQEEKELLIKDLCSRLPYGVYVEENREKLDSGPIIYTHYYHPFIEDCKPYLRPMTDMNENEMWDYEYKWKNHTEWEAYDYLNSIHIDYRGLIGKGLAIEAPEGMY